MADRAGKSRPLPPPPFPPLAQGLDPPLNNDNNNNNLVVRSRFFLAITWNKIKIFISGFLLILHIFVSIYELSSLFDLVASRHSLIVS